MNTTELYHKLNTLKKAVEDSDRNAVINTLEFVDVYLLLFYESILERDKDEKIAAPIEILRSGLQIHLQILKDTANETIKN